MKIGLQTWGSDGDINPFIALAGGLAARGHEVTLAITSAERKDYGGYGERLGFRIVEVGHIGCDEADLLRIARLMYDKNDPLKQLDLILETMFEPGVELMSEAADLLCRENDLLVGHFIVHPAQAAAEKCGRPYLTVTLNHSAIPSRYSNLMGAPDLGSFLNGLIWKLGQMVLDSHILPHVNKLRRKLALPEAKDYRRIWESRLANLIAVSPALCEHWLDREPHQHLCGFFRIAVAGEAYEPPQGLEEFLAAGEKPVYFTFGSMMAVEGGTEILVESTRLLVEGARLAGCRAIIQSRWGALPSMPEYPDIFRVTSVPHSRLFPRCRAVVHHGGAGTTHTSLLHGLPALIVPHISDQFFWARELKRLGVGLSVADRKNITPEKLAAALRKMLADNDMLVKSEKMAEKMALEDGVANAVRLIEQLF